MIRKKLAIFTGYFGSGKTELVINFANHLRQNQPFVVVDDVDVVNPYFRVRDQRGFLQARDIKLVAPEKRLLDSDLPIVSAEIHKYINDENYHVIFDVGGDADGAKAMGQYYHSIKSLDYEVIFVLNACRPYVNSKAGIITTLESIVQSLRLPVTAIINNTNCGSETTLDVIEQGHHLAMEVAKDLNISYYGTTICETLAKYKEQWKYEANLFFIKRYMKLSWANQ